MEPLESVEKPIYPHAGCGRGNFMKKLWDFLHFIISYSTLNCVGVVTAIRSANERKGSVMKNSNGQVQKIAMQPGVANSKLEHLRGILSKLQQTMEARRDERMGRTTKPALAAVPQNIAFPKPVITPSTSGKPRATSKSLSDFEAAFARLTSRQAS